MSSGNRAEREETLEPTCLITSLPNEVLVDIIARLPICYHPAISVVSRLFRSLVSSPELYELRRSLFDYTEPCLYVVLQNIENSENRVHILRRKPNGDRRLVLIPSLPALPREASFVAVGSKIHVFGGFYRRFPLCLAKQAFSIDCRYHTVQPLPSMPVPVTTSFARIMDEKIYVFGDTNYNSKVMVVLNTETQTWEPGTRVPDIEVGHELYGCVVMENKMYVKHSLGSFVYEPKENTWEEAISLMKECVIDDKCYYYDRRYNELLAYDYTKESYARVVIGVEKLVDEARRSGGLAYTVSYGGKLLFLFQKRKSRSIEDLWCAEITLSERDRISGKVEWCDLVFAGNFYVIESLVAMGLSDMSVDLEMASE